MDGWDCTMARWIPRWTAMAMDKWIDRVDRLTDGLTDRWIARWTAMDKWIVGWTRGDAGRDMDGWDCTDSWIGRSVDRLIG